MKRVSISGGNIKVGKLPNVSLTPCAGCRPDAPCRDECYAKKAFRQYKETRKAWNNNLQLARNDRDGYFSDIVEALLRSKTTWFRWHVSGDILDQDYLEGMKEIAEFFPHIKFLAFTKMHHLDFSNLPDNLTVVFSMWKDWGDTTKDMPRAWVQAGSDSIPETAIECPGLCENCMMCWNLPKIGQDVYFNIH